MYRQQKSKKTKIKSIESVEKYHIYRNKGIGSDDKGRRERWTEAVTKVLTENNAPVDNKIQAARQEK